MLNSEKTQLSRKRIIPYILIFLISWVCYCQPDPINTPIIKGTHVFYTINNLSESISIINPQTFDYANHAILTDSIPNQLRTSDDQLWILNSGSNNLQSFSTETYSLQHRIDVGIGSNPIDFVQDSQFLYITTWLTHELILVNRTTHTIEHRIAIPSYLDTSDSAPHPQGIAVSAEYIAICLPFFQLDTLSFGQAKLLILDKDQLTKLTVLETAANPQTAFFTPDQSFLHVLCSGKNGGTDSDDGRIDIFETETWGKINQVPIGGSPASFALDPEKEQVYLGGVGGVTVYNYSTLEVLYSFSNSLIQTDDTENELFAGLDIIPELRMLAICNFTKDQLILRQLDAVDVSYKTLNVGDGPLAVTH